uniref:VP n=1 Tax=Phylloscopus proregulus Brevihamaparvovirus TaxID=2794566 RepID=A0A8A4XE48_9VIRU|nr:MAG: VP [Phylloscopus proregulus Brevihamaparvovirus]
MRKGYFDKEIENEMSGGGYVTNKNKQDEEGVKQGVGNIVPIPKDNIWNKGNLCYPYKLKQRYFVDLDFSGLLEFQGFVVPYQTIPFWFNRFDDTSYATKQNYAIWNALEGQAWGMDWNHGSIKIDVISCTRQRLLQTGTTNTLTWDFETSQNLIIAECTRTPLVYNVAVADLSGQQFNINTCKTRDSTYWNDGMDMTDVTEVPQRMRWEKHINFAKLGHGNVWEPIQAAVTNNTKNKMIPGRTQFASAGGTVTTRGNYAKLTNITHQESTGSTAAKVVNDSFVEPKHYPGLVIHQPHIPDETGFMKFRYQVRVETELDVNFHMFPEGFVNSTPGSISQSVQRGVVARYIMPYETFAPIADTSYNVICVPYNLTK